MQEIFKGVPNTKRRILVAAVKAFSAKGYKTSNVDQIAQDARVAKGTIYNHFKSKEQLLNDLVELSIKHFMIEISKKVAEAKNSEERVRFLIQAQCELDEQYPDINRVIVMNYYFLDRVWKNLREKKVSFGHELIEVGQKDGTFSAELDPRIVSMILHFYILTIRMVETVLIDKSFKEICENLEKIMVKGLRK